MRRAAKIDATQPAIVAALRRMGVFVQSLAAVGNGVPDLLCATKDRLVLLEVKDAESSRGTELTPAQKAWHASCPRPVAVVTTPTEALEAVLGISPPKGKRIR